MLIPLLERATKHETVGYVLDESRKRKIPVEAKFVFTMLDRQLSTAGEKVYRRVENVRAAWGALFIAAGLAKSKQCQMADNGVRSKQGKYKGNIKRRTDVAGQYTRHDMRRGFNAEAEKAGLELKDRCAILGHTPQVNRKHYLGEQQVNPLFLREKLAKISDLLKVKKDSQRP